MIDELPPGPQQIARAQFVRHRAILGGDGVADVSRVWQRFVRQFPYAVPKDGVGQTKQFLAGRAPKRVVLDRAHPVDRACRADHHIIAAVWLARAAGRSAAGVLMIMAPIAIPVPHAAVTTRPSTISVHHFRYLHCISALGKSSDGSSDRSLRRQCDHRDFTTS